MSFVNEQLALLPDGWQKQFLSMYDAGASDHEVMREFGITPKAFKAMYNDICQSEFQEVVDYGRALSRAWWEAQARTNLKGKGFNTRLFEIVMQNRFDWASKEHHTVSEDPIAEADDATLDERIEQLAGKKI